MNVTQINDFLKKVAFIAENSTCGYKVGCVGVIKDEGQKISLKIRNLEEKTALYI